MFPNATSIFAPFYCIYMCVHGSIDDWANHPLSRSLHLQLRLLIDGGLSID